MARHVFVVLTNAVPGQDEAFNRWYDDQHVGDILRLPGLVSAQRFRLSAEQSAETPYRYLALYEIETDDLATTIRALKAGEGTDVIPGTPAIDPKLFASFFEPIGPLVTAAK